MPTTLRIIEGPGKGTEFPINTGDTIIGRGAKAQVKLTAPEVSWEHAIITRLGEDWMIENLSAHGTQVNDQKISGRTRLRPRDRIRVTEDTVLRFDSTDGPQVNVLGNPWVMRGIIAVVVLLIIAWAGSAALRKPTPQPNYNYAFTSITKWLQDEVSAGRMHPEVVAMFASARAQEQAAGQSGSADATDKTALAYKVAAGRYQKLQLFIDGLEDKYHCMDLASKDPQAIDRKLLYSNGAADMDTDAYAASFEEFVSRKLQYCNNRAGISK